MANEFWDAANNAFNMGQATAKAIHDRQDQAVAQQAGNAFAAGNYTGAANAYFHNGQNDQGLAAINAQQAQQDRKTQLQAAADAAEKSQLADQTTATLAGLRALQGIADPNQRAQYYASNIAPVLKQRGVPDEGIAHIGQITGDDNALKAEEMALGQAVTKYGFNDVGGDLYRTNPDTGDVAPVAQGYRKPEYVTPAAGTTAVLVDPGRAGGVIGPGGTAQPVQGQPAGLPPQASRATPAPAGGVYGAIGQQAAAAGASQSDVAYLQRTAQLESGGKQSAANGSSQGTFQFHPQTFHSVLPQGDITSQADQTKAALILSQRDRQALQQNGVQPDDANTYIMHQQGSGGGLALLTAPPEVGAVAALTPVYGSAKIATQAIVRNGGKPNMTAGQFVQMWRDKYYGGAQQQTAPTAQAAWSPPRTVQGPPKEEDAGDATLSGDALDQAGERYVANGTLPPLGMGKAGSRNRALVLNRAAEIEKATGVTGQEAAARWVEMKANSHELQDATQQRGRMQVAEGTASRNADLMLSLAPKGGGPSGIPVVNRWLQAGRKQIAGDPDVTGFDISIGTFADEYAKVVTGATGNQGSTDSARKEAYDRLSKFASQGQLETGVATMKQEMANRTAEQDARVARAASSLRPKPSGSNPATVSFSSGIGPNGHSPIFTLEQARAASQNPANKGHGYYDTDGNYRTFH